MRGHRSRMVLAGACGTLFASLGTAAFADEATGKVVWFDSKNSNLLLECPDKGCPKIPNATPGETYTFVVPSKVKSAVGGLKEGQTVTLVYDDGKDKGYVIRAVK